ncbi:DUF4124 domain-containing protein [Marinobacter fuscus]|uniref:DUF4124 domain-containing protein n=1 Tax=Marinobacter fuscus TaxID=2109942 RepID=A0A2T1K6U2_9GAMM|nr:DUF4124 domain-containing protein [Marinobacter fuscus]PSF05876.1 DUF4124 domain-containing protein [Marinobacter fuscus]
MNRKTLLLTIVLAAAPAIGSGASVYKWTDANGVTHFGDRQPTGQSAEQVNVRAGTSRNPPAQRQSAQEQLEALESEQAAQQQRQKESAVEEARRKQREANCSTARANLGIIESNARIRVEENGESRYLSPEEIEQQRQQFQRIADENCGAEE